MPIRTLTLLIAAAATAPLMAQDAAGPTTAAGGNMFQVANSLNYAMLGLAVVQAIFILAITGIMRTMGGAGAWAKRIVERRSRGLVVLPLALMFSTDANAQTYQGGGGGISNYHLFWLLAATNVLLFVIMIVQITLLRGMVTALTATDEQLKTELKPTGPSWVERLSKRLTRQVALEKEEDILMHHEYDGIRELDNVLPPWWVWLFYGTIIWGVIYLFNVHVLHNWPDQKTEYANEMEKAKTDVAAYMATLTNTVDENTVKATEDPAILASGRNTFTQFCTACHMSNAAGSETSVGPNLTDEYWIHGGGVKNIFHTITFGVPEKGMISWKAQLKPSEIAALASYILSLKGTGPAMQKAPQGDRWTEPAPSTDSTAVLLDSLTLVVDTARMANLK